jgi:hypothetical protein
MIKHVWELKDVPFDPYIIEWNGLLNDDWQLHFLLPRIWLSRQVLCGRFCSSLEPMDKENSPLLPFATQNYQLLS